MLTLVLTVLLIWTVLTLLLSAWSLLVQAYVYSEPVENIHWRGPAAGSAITLLICIWLMFDYLQPGCYRPLHDFSGRTNSWYKELRIPNDRGKEDVYVLRRTPQGEQRYYAGSRELPTRPRKIVVHDPTSNEEHVFEPERDGSGHFKIQPNQGLRYLREDRKEVMEEPYLGLVSTYHYGWLFVDVLLNLLLLAGCFASLWLLLEFQWPHALGQAVVLWGILVLFVLPPLLTYAEERSQRSRESSSTAGAPQRMCMMSPSWTR